MSTDIRTGMADVSAPTPQSATAERSCANCGTRLIGRYCHECGQSSHLHRSLVHFGEELLHGLLHFDARGLRTLPLLALRPGLLTRRYLDGQRTRYVNPLLLFLFCIILMFFVVEMAGGSAPHTRVTAAQRAAALDELNRNLAADNAAVAQATRALAQAQTQAEAQAQRAAGGLGDARDNLAAARAQQRIDTAVLQGVRAALPDPVDAAGGGGAAGGPAASGAGGAVQWLAALSSLKVDTGHPRLDATLRHIFADPYLFLFRLRDAASHLAFLLVPISLPFLCLLFARRRDVVAYDHVVFSLYSLSFMSLLVIAVTLLGLAGFAGLAAVMLLAVPPVHMFAQLRGTYALSAGAALWRTVALLGVAGTTFLLFVGLIVVDALR